MFFIGWGSFGGGVELVIILVSEFLVLELLDKVFGFFRGVFLLEVLFVVFRRDKFGFVVCLRIFCGLFKVCIFNFFLMLLNNGWRIIIL